MSFNFLGTFREGSWRAFRKFVGEARRDVARRLASIEAEQQRIGEVIVLYEDLPNDPTKKTERRLGIVVDSGSSVHKLIQAYIALGGNPFDISMFLGPDSAVPLKDEDSGKTVYYQRYPYGGVASPQSKDPTKQTLDLKGTLPFHKYHQNKTGRRGHYWDQAKEVMISVSQIREVFPQEIKIRRNELEARIIKLCDLYEQFEQEKDLILRRLGDSPNIVTAEAFEQRDLDFSVARNLKVIDKNFYEDGLLPDPREPGFDKLSPRPYYSLLDNIEQDDGTYPEHWSAL